MEDREKGGKGRVKGGVKAVTRRGKGRKGRENR